MIDPKKILVIQLRRLGDVMVTTPAVEALRLAFPRAEIDFLVEPPGDQLLEGNPHLTRVLRYETDRPLAMIRRVRERRYDWVLDFLGTPRSAVLTAFSGAGLRAGPGHVFHTWAYQRRFPDPIDGRYTGLVKLDYLRETFGIAAPPRVSTRMTLPETARTQAAAFWKGLGLNGGFVLGVAPLSRRETRQWPRERFADLLKMADVPALIFWGGRAEEADARWIQQQVGKKATLIPDTRDLKLVGALLERCGAVVALDNGIKHMAMALGVPTLSVHGATKPSNWNPPGDARFPVVRREELFCIGCEKNECPYRVECLSGLDARRVLARLEDLIKTHGLRETPETAIGH